MLTAEDLSLLLLVAKITSSQDSAVNHVVPFGPWRFDHGSDIGLTLGQMCSLRDAGLTEVFRNLQTTAERHSGAQTYTCDERRFSLLPQLSMAFHF